MSTCKICGRPCRNKAKWVYNDCCDKCKTWAMSIINKWYTGPEWIYKRIAQQMVVNFIGMKGVLK